MNADARTQAWEYYKAAGRQMDADLEALATHPQGVILLMPRLVVLMKPVLSSAPELWPQLEHVFPAADAWYVHLLAGDLRLARQLATALPPRPRRSAISSELTKRLYFTRGSLHQVNKCCKSKK